MIFPAETLSYPEFDYGFIGEAEGPLVDFLDSMCDGSRDLTEIPGLVWRSGDDVIINDSMGFNADLDMLPFPAYHLLNLTEYKMPTQMTM